MNTTPEPNAALAQQVVKASRELDRLHGLLIDAITSLMHHFSKVSELTDGQTELLDQALALASGSAGGAGGAGGEAEEMGKLAAGLSHEIGLHLNGALTALQFQDMSSQLINHIRERVAAMNDVLAAPLAAEIVGVEGTRDAKTFGPVSQEKLRGGTVELF